MEVHQVLVSAVPGDAITTVALELQALLARTGPSGVYARYIHPDMEGRFEFLEALAARRSETMERDIIVFHASIGEPPVFEFLRERRERLVVDYHNISPAGPFYPYDPTFAGRLEGGRREVAALAERAVLGLANSAYSAAELVDMGYREVRVTPLLADWTRLVSAPVPAELEQRITATTEGPVVLFVGQLLPHKRPDLLIDTFHVLSTYLRPDASLVMVGAPRLPRYFQALAGAAAELNLRRVRMRGAVTEAELAAWYRRADVFVTASEHEGFCVPLLEAMAFDVPIVARSFAAVPETLGPAGILLPSDGSVELAAEALNAVLGHQAVRRELIGRGRDRLTAFDPARLRAAFRDQLLEVAAA